MKKALLPVLLVLLLAGVGCSAITGETHVDTPVAGTNLFRSETYHLSALLPEGWAGTEGPYSIPLHLQIWVAFNSWGEPYFFAGPVVRGTSQVYGPGTITAKLRPGGAYVALVETTMPNSPDFEPQDYASRDLSGLYEPHDWREDPVAGFFQFYKWGHNLTLTVACTPDATDETVSRINDLLGGFWFDAAPENGTASPGTGSLPVTVVFVAEPPAGPTIVPAGPLVEIALQNTSGRDITSLDVVLDEGGEHRRWTFNFGVSAINPFLPGQTLTADSRLVGGGFGGGPPYGNFPYTLEISGAYDDGTTFDFTWEPPGPS